MEKDINFKNDPEINKLREERDSLTNQSIEIQKKIDDLIMKKTNFDKLVGRYFYIFDLNVYFKVKSVERRYHGVEIHGVSFITAGDDYLYFDPNDSISRDLSNLIEMKEISEETFYKNLHEKLDKIKTKY